MKPSKKIVAFIILAGFLLAGAFYLSRNKESPDNERLAETKKTQETLKIGFITDAHCYANDKDSEEDSEEEIWSLNWRCTQPLEAFVQKMNNEFQPDFVIQDGDLIDGKDGRAFEDFIEIKQIYDRLNAPHYHVLGNHEMKSFEKNIWLDLIDYEKPYYFFDIKEYRIIVLDGNNKPQGEGFQDTSPEVEFYPGAVDTEQMQWLEKTLREANDLIKIVFVHQPPVETDAKELGELFWNGAELQNLFEQNGVQAVFSGHIERNCMIEKNGIAYYVLNGFWKGNGGLKEEFQYKNGGVFSEIVVKGDEIEVRINFRKGKNQIYESAIMTSQNARCQDSSTLAGD